MAGAYGRFIPKNPEKYLGDASKIMFRSSWEVSVMKWLDSRDAVLKWGSEEIKIAYFHPIDARVRNYVPDFVALIQHSDGSVKKHLIEVKPRHESDEHFARSDRSKDALEVNNAKWKAAKIFCDLNGLEFMVITEHSIFHQKPKKK